MVSPNLPPFQPDCSAICVSLSYFAVARPAAAAKHTGSRPPSAAGAAGAQTSNNVGYQKNFLWSFLVEHISLLSLELYIRYILLIFNSMLWNWDCGNSMDFKISGQNCCQFLGRVFPYWIGTQILLEKNVPRWVKAVPILAVCTYDLFNLTHGLFSGQ